MKVLSLASLFGIATLTMSWSCTQAVAPDDSQDLPWDPTSSSDQVVIDDQGPGGALPECNSTARADTVGTSALESARLPQPDFGESSAVALDEDVDGDGVMATDDCNDRDNRIGKLIHLEGFTSDNDWFHAPPELSEDPWVYGPEGLLATGGGLQAVLGEEEDWQNVIIHAVVTADGTSGGENYGPTNHWRIGLLVRAEENSGQQQGFLGYRCALASNAEGVGDDPLQGPSTGQFVQLAELPDQTTTANASATQSTRCRNASSAGFVEIGRNDFEGLDLVGGQDAVLAFAAVENSLSCEVVTTRETVSVQVEDTSLDIGTIGLSTMNMFGKFKFLTVCEMLTP